MFSSYLVLSITSAVQHKLSILLFAAVFFQTVYTVFVTAVTKKKKNNNTKTVERGSDYLDSRYKNNNRKGFWEQINPHPQMKCV